MTHQEKIEALMAAVNDNIVLPECQKKTIKAALVEGFIRILYAEEAEARAKQPYTYFPVELGADKGFMIWNSGGFDPQGNSGEARLCVGLDGRHTKVVRTVKERNGRHELAIIYQDCFIADASVSDSLATPDIVLYQAMNFCSRGNGYEVRCRKVWANHDRTESKLKEDVLERFNKVIGLCGDIACTPNLYRMEWP